MPELPEVETIRRGLEEKLVGLRIVGVEVRAPRIFVGEPKDLVGREIIALQRQGKLLIVRLDDETVLTIHLKMTGQLIWKPEPVSRFEVGNPDEADNATLSFDEDEDEDEESEVVVGGHPEASYLDPLPHKHTHVVFSFSDGSKLYFNDLRKFGRITMLSAEALPRLAFLEQLGPEPLEADFTYAYLQGRIAKRPRMPIKTFLLDQTNIAGLGNIYADESLFRAAVLPDRTAGSLNPGEVRNLFDSIKETLELALRHGGSSSQNYLNAVGERGTYLKIANVYRRTGLECNRCLVGVIERKKIGGRSSHYCAVCQR